MLDWERLTLFFYILTRMSGFVLFSPVLGRQSIPGIVRAGFILVLAITVTSFTPGGAPMPTHLLQFALNLFLELSVGLLLGFAMQLFFYIPLLAGEVLDTQFGFTMGKIYDAGSQTSMSVTSTLLNIFMFLLFFTANGHHTLLRILLTSGSVIPFGQAAINPEAAWAIGDIFVSCTLLAVKLALPILAAELMGQVGMGILMKAIPQINVFAINIELKVVVGLVMIMFLITPFSEFLLAAENQMLGSMQDLLRLALPSP
ncbi:MAG: fliR [Firmicutes bacterium]|nr:fliR [Bacillota bacterium]